MSYEFPEDWYEDIDGRSRMLSYEKVGAEIERLRAALTRIRDRTNDMPRVPRNDYADGEKYGIQWASDIAEDALNQQQVTEPK